LKDPHIVVGPQFEADDAVGLLGSGGQEDDRDVRAPPHLPRHLDAIESRHVDVENGAIGRSFAEKLERLAAVEGDEDFEAGRGEIALHELGDLPLVVGYDDPLGYAVSPGLQAMPTTS
jgi:hypothetical protein